MAIGTQIGFAIAGFAATIAAAIAGPDGDSWLGVSVLTAVVCAISSLSVLSGRETHKIPTEDLGLKPGRTAAPAREAATV